MCAVFWLFWLSYQYLSSDWLERSLVYCIDSLFYYVSVLSPSPTWYIFLFLMARYSTFVLKVPLNPKQTNKQTALVHNFAKC